MNIIKKRLAASALSLALAAASFGWAPIAAPAYAAADESVSSAPAYASLFQGDNIINVNVTIDEEDWESILASPLDKEYKSVSVDIDGTKLNNVGFSTKGNMTLSSVASMDDSDRYSFRLKFDKYDKTQTLLGLDKMVLNNNYTDPSYLREYLHYEALRNIGLDVPMTAFVNLYINGELFGFYTGVEAIDDSYLERNYGEDYEEGVLYDTEEKSYLQYEESGDYRTITEDLGTDEDKAKLKNFIQTLNDMPEGEKGDIESVLDVDSALKYIAGNVVFGNYDSYNGDKGHNYMLYGNAAGKFTVVPWDFNMSFGGYSGGGGGRSAGASGTTTNVNATNVSVDEPVLGISMDSVPMIGKLLAVPEYKARYLEYVNELVDDMEGIQSRIAELSDLIRPYVEADPTRFYTLEQFESNVAYSAAGVTGGMAPPEGMNGMTPPDGAAPPDGSAPPTRPGANGSNGGGMGMIASGSLMTFALNRLANLQEQLGREVIELPAATNESAGGGVATDDASSESGSGTSGSGTSGSGASGSSSSGSRSGIQVILNGKTLSFPDQAPMIKNNRIMVPLSAVLQALGAEVFWNPAAKSVKATLGEYTLIVPINGSTATVNGASVKLDVPAMIRNNRTLASIRFISEGLGLKLSWDQAAAQVNISSK